MGARKRVLAVLLSMLLSQTFPGPAFACPVFPQVVALGGGVIWVREAGGFRLFSSVTGELLETLRPLFLVNDVHFDPRGREFWGTGSEMERPLVWSWSRPRGFFTLPVLARTIYQGFQASDGGRIVAASLSTAASWEEVSRSYIAIGRWRAGKVRFESLAPPMWLEEERGPAFLGKDTLITSLLDPDKARAFVPSVPGLRADAWLTAHRLRGDRWLLTEPKTSRVWIGSAGGAWETGPMLPTAWGILDSDPFSPGSLYRLSVNGPLEGPAQLRRHRGGGAWETVWEAVSVPECQGPSWPIALHFDEEGIWIELTDPPQTDRAFSIRLIRIPRGGTRQDRELRLAAPLADQSVSDE